MTQYYHEVNPSLTYKKTQIVRDIIDKRHEQKTRVSPKTYQPVDGIGGV